MISKKNPATWCETSKVILCFVKAYGYKFYHVLVYNPYIHK
jgi:hypothetical protein